MIRANPFDIRAYGAQKPDSRTLAPYAEYVGEHARSIGLSNRLRETVPEDQVFGFYCADPQPFDGTPGRLRYWLRNDVDDNRDGKITLGEVALYGYRVDQMGNRDGVVQENEFMHARALSYKGYLHAEAAQYLDADSRERLTAMLAGDRFIATPQAEDPVEILGESTDPDIVATRAIQAAVNYDDCIAAISRKKDETGHLGRVMKGLLAGMGTDPAAGMKKLFLKRFLEDRNAPRIEARKEKEGEVSPKGWTLHQWQAERNTDISCEKGVTDFRFTLTEMLVQPSPYGPAFQPSVEIGSRKKFDVMVKEPDSYRLSPDEMKPHLKQLLCPLKTALSQHAELLGSIYDHTLEMATDEKLMREKLSALGQVLQSAFGLQEKVRLELSDDGAPGDGACYLNNSRTVRYFRNTYAERLGKMVAKKMPESGIRSRLFRDIANLMAHEYFHAAQGDWTRDISGKTPKPLPNHRLMDYWMEDRYRGTAFGTPFSQPVLSVLLTGAAERYYRQSPSEADAYMIGDSAEEIAARVLEKRAAKTCLRPDPSRAPQARG